MDNTKSSSEQITYSFIAPLLNEEGNVQELHRQIVETATRLGEPYEIIFVDDGSTDRTAEIARSLSPVTVIEFRRRFGQTAGLDAGIKAARGSILCTMDGDLQDDPAEIPKLLEKMHTEGYDVVASWRYNRKDSVAKRLVSRVADKLRKALLHDTIHDSGCQLRVYKRECFDGVDLFGEMHRFIPALLELDGWRIGEVKVTHRPRTAGTTKYNWRRSIKGFADMVAMGFWQRFRSRPLHFFGGVGLISIAVGMAILVWMLVEKIVFGASISERIWPLLGVFGILTGIQLFTFGLLMDVAMRNYYRTANRMNYVIKRVTHNR